MEYKFKPFERSDRFHGPDVKGYLVDGKFYAPADVIVVTEPTPAEDYVEKVRRWTHFCAANAGRAVAWDIAHIKHCPNCGAAPPK